MNWVQTTGSLAKAGTRLDHIWNTIYGKTRSVNLLGVNIWNFDQVKLPKVLQGWLYLAQDLGQNWACYLTRTKLLEAWPG